MPRLIHGEAVNAKFPNYTTVLCYPVNSSIYSFTGVVLASREQDGDIEYEVSNAPECVPGTGLPLLLWESELTLP